MSEKEKDEEFEQKKAPETSENNDTPKTTASDIDFNIYKDPHDNEIMKISEEIKKRQKLRQIKYKKTRRKKTIKIFVLLFVFLLCAGFGACYFLFPRTLKSSEYIENYFNESIYNKKIYIDGEKTICLSSPVFEENDVYIPVSFVFTNFGHNILYDYENKILSIATELEAAKFTLGESFYYVNGEKINFGKPAVIQKDSELQTSAGTEENEVYISKEILEKFYSVSISFSKENTSVIIEDTSKERTSGTIISDDVLTDDKKNSLDIKIKKGDYVSVYSKKEDMVKISTSDGFVGYTSDGNIENKTSLPPVEKASVPSQALSVKGKAVILFDQVTNTTANYNSIKNGIPTEADVLVPTWFSFEQTEDGAVIEIISIGNEDYVANAHDKGVKVWGLITDNFSSKVSRAVVKSAKTRENVINQIVTLARQYNLDGINIDFESIPDDSMREFTQFLRELSAALNNLNLALSIDVYTPSPWSSYYNRDEFGEIADYFIVMGYDEHTDGSGTSGSVATKKWSEESIALTEEAGVPADKLLLGIPFYTRIWKESGGNIETRAYGMTEGKKAMTDKGALFNWSEEDGQNYAEINYENALYKMWLEDEQSVAERLKLIKKYDIAGLAAWRKGLETNEVWNTIKEYMKG